MNVCESLNFETSGCHTLNFSLSVITANAASVNLLPGHDTKAKC